jgi:hypothetical protein
MVTKISKRSLRSFFKQKFHEVAQIFEFDCLFHEVAQSLTRRFSMGRFAFFKTQIFELHWYLMMVYKISQKVASLFFKHKFHEVAQIS